MTQPPPSHVEDPPQTITGILRRLGPGLVIAAAIVGSGELIATTKTGAQAGFSLLWLILLGCVVKLFTQVEFGRYTVCNGRTAMAGMNEVPGPRLGPNWLLWYWLVMFIVGLAQLGGIVGGVGQSLAMTLPITGDFNQLLEDQEAWDRDVEVARESLQRQAGTAGAGGGQSAPTESQIQAAVGRPRPERSTRDDLYWAAIVTLITVPVLASGRYSLVEAVSTVLVASFTLVTIVNLLVLQTQPGWAIEVSELRDGLSFRLPPMVEGLTRTPLATALAAFGIIGVGANELISYPYWCLEKGYARFTGPRDDSEAWARRARGWLRVMVWDACISMVIFTFATVAFYLLGAAVLHPSGLDPGGNQMIRVLIEMYVPVFGAWAGWMLLFGAFAVLYSTFFVANAGHARVAADALGYFTRASHTDAARQWWVRAFCIIFPVSNFLFYLVIRAPAELILASGVMQAIMLPMLAGATLFFRYRRCDPRVAPGRVWDALMWIAAIVLFVAGGWLALSKLFPALERMV